MFNRKLNLCILTKYDRNTGSTRIRVYNLIEHLKPYFKNVYLNPERDVIDSCDIVIFQKVTKPKLIKSLQKKGSESNYAP